MNKSKLVPIILFSTYLMVLIYITLLAWNYGASLGDGGPGGRNYNVIPFRSIYRISWYSPTIFDPLKIVVGNILLFIPFGFLLPFLIKIRHVKITILGFLTSFCIELIQFSFMYRVADVDDLILNTLGVNLGFFLYQLFVKLKQRIIYIDV